VLVLAPAASTVAAPQLVEPYRVAVEARGTLLVADGGRGGGRIVRVDPRTGRRTLVAGTGGRRFALNGGRPLRASLGRVTDVALGAGGAIYAVAAKRVIRIAGGRVRVLARFRAALGLALDGRRAVYVTDDEGGRLLRLDQRTRRVTTVARGLDQPIGVAVAGGRVYVGSGHDGGRVERLGDGGSRETVVDGLALPAFVTALSDGSLLVVDHVRHDARGRVLRVGRDGSIVTLSSGRIPAPLSAAATRDGTIYVTSFSRRLPLGRLDPATGELRPLGNS
jgi:DNA-binding beta-propeller fold protein YncE